MNRGRAVALGLALATFGAACSSNGTDIVVPSGSSTTSTVTTAEPPDTSEATIDSTLEAGSAVAEPTTTQDSAFPDIIAAQATREDAGTWRFDVTVSSPYDSPDRYADAWRVLGPDGEEYGVRVLTHDHANEQPFTRSQGGIDIPDDVTQVTIEGRDLSNGWGGGTLIVDLP